MNYENQCCPFLVLFIVFSTLAIQSSFLFSGLRSFIFIFAVGAGLPGSNISFPTACCIFFVKKKPHIFKLSYA